MKRTRQEVQMLSRAFASFVIATAPNVLKDEAGTLATAERRYKEFIDEVGEKLVHGPSFLDEVRAAARAASARRESSLASGEGDGAGSSTPDPDKLT